MRYEQCIDRSGHLNIFGVQYLKKLRNLIDSILNGHLDNTIMSCRVDLDGHDCCYICNDVEVALRAYVLGLEDSCTTP